jgi:hypothetical protein
LDCEIETPNLLEFLLLYLKMIRLQLESTGPISENAHSYLRETERYAKEFVKFSLVDILLVSVRPSIIAAAAVINGLFCSYRCQKAATSENEIRRIIHTWKDLSAILFVETSFHEIEEFMKEIIDRTSFIYSKHGEQLWEIF